MTNLKLRKLKKRHLKKVAELEKENFSNPWSYNSLESELNNKNAYFIVALVNDEVIGYAGMHLVLDEAYITNVVVDKNYRRLNIATYLMERLINYSKEKKAKFISLEVRFLNFSAINLYVKLGFKKVGVRKNFYTLPKEDGLIFTKVLCEN